VAKTRALRALPINKYIYRPIGVGPPSSTEYYTLRFEYILLKIRNGHEERSILSIDNQSLKGNILYYLLIRIPTFLFCYNFPFFYFNLQKIEPPPNPLLFSSASGGVGQGGQVTFSGLGVVAIKLI